MTKLENKIMNDVGYYLNRKKTFETILARSGANMMSDECKKLLNIRDDKLWQVLRSKVYEKLRNIGV